MQDPETITPQEDKRPDSPLPTAAHPVPGAIQYTRARRARHSFFWPIALIAFGALLLLSNLGLIPATGWAVLWRFWPIAVIALGIDVLIGRRSVAGAVAGGVLVLVLVGVAIGIALFAEQMPFLVDLARPATLQFDHVEYPATGLESAVVTIDWTSAPGYLSALEDSGNVIEADIAYRGKLAFDAHSSGSEATITLDTYLQGVSYGNFTFDDGQDRWDVGLSPDVTLDLRLDASSGSGHYDLTGLAIDRLQLDAGSGAVDLTLPARMSFAGDVDGGSGALRLHVPSDVGVRLTLDHGSGSFRPGDTLTLISGKVDGDGVWETPGFDAATHQIELAVDQGSGSLSVD